MGNTTITTTVIALLLTSTCLQAGCVQERVVDENDSPKESVIIVEHTHPDSIFKAL